VLQRARPFGKQPVLVVRSLFPVEHHDKMPSLVYTDLSSVSLSDGFAAIPQMRRTGQTHFCNRFFLSMRWSLVLSLVLSLGIVEYASRVRKAQQPLGELQRSLNQCSM
jgi:hypothetical protein